MKYTNEQIRGAILRAADRIEREPKLYDFGEITVPSCGTPGCMWGWIGFELATERRIVNDVACDVNGASFFSAPDHLYNFCQGGFSGYVFSPQTAVAALRAYADAFYPALSTQIVAEDRQLVRWDQCAWKPAGVRA